MMRPKEWSTGSGSFRHEPFLLGNCTFRDFIHLKEARFPSLAFLSE
jgi:hypothetical protein